MNKKVVGIVFLVAVLMGLGITCYSFMSNNKLTDAERFYNDYKKVGEKNVFVYRNASEVVKILKNGTGVVFFGFPECPWCQEYAPKLNEVARDLGLFEIYYCNIKKDRANNTKEYKEIVSILGDNLNYDDEGNHRLFVPDVVVVKDGVILSHNNETSMATEETDGKPEDYWTKDKRDNLRLQLESMLQPLIDDVCTDCNE